MQALFVKEGIAFFDKLKKVQGRSPVLFIHVERIIQFQKSVFSFRPMEEALKIGSLFSLRWAL